LSSGASCDFNHPTAPDGTVTNHICSFFGSLRGCVKADKCPYLHPIRYNPQGEPCTRVCDFFLTAQGCVKSNSCDYLHPKAVPAIYNMGGAGRGLDSLGIPHRGAVPRAASASAAASASSSSSSSAAAAKPCKFLSTAEGCRRGTACHFAHPGSAAPPQPAAAAAGARAPNVLRGGVGSRGASIVPSIHKLPRPCQYFGTKQGCKKGYVTTRATRRGADRLHPGSIASRSFSLRMTCLSYCRL
jgi:hypothetical protein